MPGAVRGPGACHTYCYSALQEWDYMLLSLACFTYWWIVNITVQRTTSFFLMSAWCHFPTKWLYNNLISPLLLGISIISGLQILYWCIALNIPVLGYLHIWMSVSEDSHLEGELLGQRIYAFTFLIDADELPAKNIYFNFNYPLTAIWQCSVSQIPTNLGYYAMY